MQCIRTHYRFNPQTEHHEEHQCERAAVLGDFCRRCFRYVTWRKQECLCGVCGGLIDDPVIDAHVLYDTWVICHTCHLDQRRYHKGGGKYRTFYERLNVDTDKLAQLEAKITADLETRLPSARRPKSLITHVTRKHFKPYLEPETKPVMSCDACGVTIHDGFLHENSMLCYRCWRSFKLNKRRRRNHGLAQRIQMTLRNIEAYREYGLPITFSDEARLLNALGVLSRSARLDHRYRFLVMEWFYSYTCGICRTPTPPDQWVVSWDYDHAECLKCYREGKRLPFRRDILPFGLAVWRR